ncbi:uncharacterized protein LOC116215058 [Punica granatum]|uniref:Uncharacterized protein n=2 Tax=Punica granatum TaxID=22663 RepID=A0A218WDL0_PUNGR|nr:uncharacterized protein LOC116215058 [Punica granatum]OWM70613.1 hypothetical protein CDL15_Pgr014286 [Punica granatum]PKI55151.1 hypothetical protein CRG98_024442 [Punica granatum]
MAASHIRSNSLPSRTHPLSNIVEEKLQRLRSSEGTSTSLSVCRKLGGLKNLYDSVDDWLQLSLTQQILSRQNNRQCVEHLLEGSVQTLDVCATLREVLSQMKESLRELESSLRRRTALANKLDPYITSRKKMKKIICRMMENLKKMEKKQNIVKKDNQVEQEAARSILKEVEETSISVFESFLCFLSKPKTRSSGWSLVSKVVSSKRISCEAAADASEVEELDIELLIMKSNKDNSILMRDVQKRVEALESSIREIEEVCECVYRSLVKTRVSLLNILDH